jgi:hypothetical protein
LSANVIATTVPRRFPANLGAQACALLVAVLAEALNRPELYCVIAAAFAAGLALTWENWIGRRSGGIAFVLSAGAVLGTLVSGGDLARVATAASRMSEVIVLILCVALIRPALAALRLDHAVAAMAAYAPPPLRGCAVLFGVAVFGLGLSFGAVSVFGGSLRGRTNSDPVAARAAMRGLSLSMLLGPSTASVAAVMAAYPQVGWGQALSIGLPIALAGAVLGSFAARRLTISAAAVSRAELTQAVVAILAIPGGAMVMHFGFGFSITLGISVSAVATAMVLLLRSARGNPDWQGTLSRFDFQVGEAWRQAGAETALFLACGLVLGAMREPALAEPARMFVAAVLPAGLPGLLVLTIVVPLIATIGIHPMALFAILGPVATPSLLGLSDPCVFQAWIVAIGLSMVVSPASVSTITAVASFGVPTNALCLRGNGLYALGFALIATTLLFLLS